MGVSRAGLHGMLMGGLIQSDSGSKQMIVNTVKGVLTRPAASRASPNSRPRGIASKESLGRVGAESSPLPTRTSDESCSGEFHGLYSKPL